MKKILLSITAVLTFHIVEAQTVPGAPTINSVSFPANNSTSVFFTAGSDGGATITNYEYSVDGGTTFAACSPAQTSSPLTIDLSVLSGTGSSNIVVRAINSVGSGASSNSFSASYTKLPIELIYFKNNRNYLIWETASEKNNAGFEIYKSKDAVLWIKESFVKGMGNSVVNNAYSFLTSDQESMYYRLKQIDNNEDSKWLPIIYVLRTTSSNTYFSIDGKSSGSYYYENEKKYFQLK